MPQKLLTDLPTDVVQHILARIQLVHHIGRAAPTCRVISVAARNARKMLADLWSRRAAARRLIELPADVLGLVLYQLTLAHDIAAVAPTCHVFCDAAKLALKLRPFSRAVVTLDAHGGVSCVMVATDGSVVTGSWDNTLKVWHDGACVRTIQVGIVDTVAALPGGRFVCGSPVFHAVGTTARLWTAGALERTFEMGSYVLCIAALPDGVHFVVGLGRRDDESGAFVVGNDAGEVRLYHVDGTLVHAFRGHTKSVTAVAVTTGGQHIISGSGDNLVKVWSVANQSLVSTCTGHTGRVHAVAAMPDGLRILSGSVAYVDVLDNTLADVRVWRLNLAGVWLPDGRLENTFIHLHTSSVTALVALPDNQHALSGSADKTIQLFNVNDGSVLNSWAYHTETVECLALLPDGLRFVSCDFMRARIAYHGLFAP